MAGGSCGCGVTTGGRTGTKRGDGVQSGSAGRTLAAVGTAAEREDSVEMRSRGERKTDGGDGEWDTG